MSVRAITQILFSISERVDFFKGLKQEGRVTIHLLELGLERE